MTDNWCTKKPYETLVFHLMNDLEIIVSNEKKSFSIFYSPPPGHFRQNLLLSHQTIDPILCRFVRFDRWIDYLNKDESPIRTKQ